MKPGYQTTEFWLTAAEIITGFLLASDVIAEGTPWAKLLGIVSSTLVTLGYTYSRGHAKSKPAPEVEAPEAMRSGFRP